MNEIQKSTYALQLQCDCLQGHCNYVYVVNSADIVPGQKPRCPKCHCSPNGATILDVLEPSDKSVSFSKAVQSPQEAK